MHFEGLMGASVVNGKPRVDFFAGGAFIEFLGRTASTPLGPAVFAKRFHSPVLPAFILRQADGRHLVKILPAMHFEDTGNTDEDLFRFTEQMTKILEQVIRENPTQWLWFQKRWNTPEIGRAHV